MLNKAIYFTLIILIDALCVCVLYQCKCTCPFMHAEPIGGSPSSALSSATLYHTPAVCLASLQGQ